MNHFFPQNSCKGYSKSINSSDALELLTSRCCCQGKESNDKYSLSSMFSPSEVPSFVIILDLFQPNSND